MAHPRSLIRVGNCWDYLPDELLRAIVFAGGALSMKMMREVNKSWQSGFESCVTHITVQKGRPYVDLPLASAIRARFPLLKGVTLNCLHFPNYNRFDLFNNFYGVPLTRLELIHCNGLYLTGLEVLRQMPLSRLQVSGGYYILPIDGIDGKVEKLLTPEVGP